MRNLRQGDWTFIEINEIPKDAEKIANKKNEYTFAEGEATNHFHTIHVPKVKDMDFYKLPDGSYAVRLKENGYATHPEHSLKVDLAVPKGMYRLMQRREKDWFSLSVRKVID